MLVDCKDSKGFKLCGTAQCWVSTLPSLLVRQPLVLIWIGQRHTFRRILDSHISIFWGFRACSQHSEMVQQITALLYAPCAAATVKDWDLHRTINTKAEHCLCFELVQSQFLHDMKNLVWISVWINPHSAKDRFNHRRKSTLRNSAMVNGVFDDIPI